MTALDFVTSRARKLAGNRFVRNVAIVATGTAGAQVITMAFSPIITRLYGPEAFGALGTFSAFLAVLAPLAALSYPVAIVLPRKDDDAVGLARLSFRLAVATSLLAGIILVSFKGAIVNTFGLQAVESIILLLPLAMFSSAAMTIMSQWVIRKSLFMVKARVAVVQAFLLNGTKAAVGLFAPLASVLVLISTLGGALHAIMLWAGVLKNTDHRSRLSVQPESAPISEKMLAWRHRDFAYYRTPQNVLNAASQSMPILMLASFFGPAAAGFYSLGRLVLRIPISLIGQSVTSVFYPRFNRAVQNGEDSYGLLRKATIHLAVIGLVPFGVIAVFGPVIFSVVFGVEWDTAGTYARFLAIWSYFGFVNRPSVGAIPVLSLQGWFLIYEIGSIVIRAVALLTGFWLYESALIAIALFSIVSAMLNAMLIVTTAVAARKRAKSRIPLS